MEASGRNFTPDKLPRAEQEKLFAICNQSLAALAATLKPKAVVGVGAFAEARIRSALPEFKGTIGRILHPSPASPAANRGWAQAATRELRTMGINI